MIRSAQHQLGFGRRGVNSSVRRIPLLSICRVAPVFAVFLVFIVHVAVISSPPPSIVHHTSGLPSRSTLVRKKRGKLRYDWTQLEILDPLAQRVYDYQHNACDLDLRRFKHRIRNGLGSHLHVYGDGLCNAMAEGYRLASEFPWFWMDEQHCSNATLDSPMLCYFPDSEYTCPNDRDLVSSAILVKNNNYLNGVLRPSDGCSVIVKETYGTVGNFRRATTTYLFSRVSQLVQQEAETQMFEVFPKDGKAPPGLITVHIRWGDKATEMELVPVETYIAAVEQILRQRNQRQPHKNKDVHVFLATEERDAVQQFRASAPSHWNIYVDAFFETFKDSIGTEFNNHDILAKDLDGMPGLVTLGSLLVAMEADSFVLTTASNWSRLMNELRQGVIDPRCNNCTLMIDLLEGEW